MRFLYRLIVFVVLSCLLTGCCFLHESHKEKPFPVGERTVQEKRDSSSTLYIVNGKHTYKYGDNINGTRGKTFLVIDTLNVDPPPVRSKPKTFINVPVPRFHRDKLRHDVILYFDINSYQLKESELEKLRNFAKSHKDKPVSVVGYTCWKGSQEYNDILAKKRAYSAVAYLKKEGFVVKSVTGKGKKYFKSRTNIALNRRVVVTVCTEKLF